MNKSFKYLNNFFTRVRGIKKNSTCCRRNYEKHLTSILNTYYDTYHSTTYNTQGKSLNELYNDLILTMDNLNFLTSIEIKKLKDIL